MELDRTRVAEPEESGVVFLELFGPITLGDRPHEIRWVTTARDDMPLSEQVALLEEWPRRSQLKPFRAYVSLEELDANGKPVAAMSKVPVPAKIVRGQTIGLCMKRSMNFTARGFNTGVLIPRAAYAIMPDSLKSAWIDIIMGEPFKDPDAMLEARVVMPIHAIELRSLGHQLREQEGEAGRDAVHLRIAEIMEKSQVVPFETAKCHPAVRRSVENLWRGPTSAVVPHM